MSVKIYYRISPFFVNMQKKGKSGNKFITGFTLFLSKFKKVCVCGSVLDLVARGPQGSHYRDEKMVIYPRKKVARGSWKIMETSGAVARLRRGGALVAIVAFLGTPNH